MENTIAKRQAGSPAFFEDSFQTLEKAKEYANLLLSSKLVPDHFFDKMKDANGKMVVDYSKGKPGAVLMVLQHGMELGFSATQALQQLVPVNGLIAIKGDGCKNLILSSRLCEKWEEKINGTIEEENYSVTITSKRKDGEEMTRTFSVDHAKRAGLWISKSQVESKENGWKFRVSAWWRFPERMIRYRALGFIARDLYPDVMQGSPVNEELIEDTTAEVLDLGSGTRLTIPDAKSQHQKELGEKISNNVVENIDKKNVNGSETDEAGTVKKYTEAELQNMGGKIYDRIKQIGIPLAKVRIIETLPVRKSNKMYRECILAYYEGKLDEKIQEIMTGKESGAPGEDQGIGSDPSITEENKGTNAVNTDDIDNVFKEKPDAVKEKENADLKPNTDFTPKKDEGSSGFPEVVELDSKSLSRPVDNIYALYEAFEQAGVTEENISEYLKGTELEGKFDSKESFLTKGTKGQIDFLIQKIKA